MRFLVHWFRRGYGHIQSVLGLLEIGRVQVSYNSRLEVIFEDIVTRSRDEKSPNVAPSLPVRAMALRPNVARRMSCTRL